MREGSFQAKGGLYNLVQPDVLKRNGHAPMAGP